MADVLVPAPLRPARPRRAAAGRAEARPTEPRRTEPQRTEPQPLAGPAVRARPAPAWWALVLGLALPGVAVLVTLGPAASGAASVQGVLARAGLIQWGSSDLGWVAGTFPPLLPAITAALGGSALVPVLVAALALAGLVAGTVASARRLGLSSLDSAALAIPLAAVPTAALAVVVAPEQATSVCLLVGALGGAVAFAARHSPRSAVGASVLLALALLAAPGAWPAVLGVGVAAAWLAGRRYPGDAAAPWAAAALVLFAPLAAAAFSVYVVWWFAPAGPEVTRLLALPALGVAGLPGLLAGLPMLAAAVVAAPRVTVVPALAALGGACWLAVGPETAYLVTTGVATALLVAAWPRHVVGRRRSLLLVLAVAQALAGCAVLLVG